MGTLAGLRGGLFPPPLMVYAGTFFSEAGSSVGGGAASSAARLQSPGERFLPVCPGHPLRSFRELQIPFAQLTAWVWLFDHVAPRSRPWVAEHEARGHRRESGRERGQPQGAQRPRRDSRLWAGRDESSPGHGPCILVDGRPAGPCDTGGHESCGGSAVAWPRRNQDSLGSMTPHFPPPGPPTAASQMTPLQLQVKGQVCTGA